MQYIIEKYNNGTRIFNISKDELNIDKTLNCGQAFRWRKLESGEWCGVIDKKLIIVEYKEFSDGKTGLYTNLSIDDAKILIDYFNLDMDYTTEIQRINLTDFEMKVYNTSKGIHILRQPLLETMITFLMSSANTMHNIRLIVEKLCEKYGDKLSIEWKGKQIIRYSFPTLEQLSKITYSEARSMSMGMRAEYFINMIRVIKDKPDILDKIQKSNYTEAMKELTKFSGVGNKVANCICLFSLHHIDAFPIDTHIKQIIDTYYNGGVDTSRFKGLAGIIQQYLFYYKAFH